MEETTKVNLKTVKTCFSQPLRYKFNDIFSIKKCVEEVSSEAMEVYVANKIIRVVSKFVFYDRNKNQLTFLDNDEFISNLNVH